MSRELFSLSIIFLSLTIAKADTLWFMRNLTCLELSEDISIATTCQRWNESTKMYFYMDYFHLCFPQGTLVQTLEGTKYIQELAVGDMILSYNNETQQNEYSPVITWISRDEEAFSTFTTIKTQGGLDYFISPLHNIGVWRTQQAKSKISYEFANTLQQGSQLADASHTRLLIIKNIEESQQMRGLYAPLTSNSNFYIYPSGTTPQNSLKQDLILVHCYSQIKNPSQYEKFVTPLLALSSFFIDEQKTQFIHPLYTKLRYFLGEEWKDQNQTVRYVLQDVPFQQKNLRTASYIIQKGGGKGGGGGHSHGSSYHHGTYSSSSSHHTRKKSAVKLFSIMSIMKDTIFNV